MATKKPENSEVVVVEMTRGSLTFCIKGTAPLVLNSMNQKTRQILLAPTGRKTTAEKSSSLKHDPLQEYRDAPYRMETTNAPTLLAGLPTWFKGGMCEAALRVPGGNKTAMKQLIQVDWPRIPLYGVPQLFMAVTRCADPGKTPDIRTRAILPEWACYLTVHFIKPVLREQSVVNLLAAAGQICGCGDWRGEKGGAFGSYTLCSADDPDFQRILASGGRSAQEAAMEQPECYDSDTSELLSWFNVEIRRRGFKVAA
jgi:hypothetical protein